MNKSLDVTFKVGIECFPEVALKAILEPYDTCSL